MKWNIIAIVAFLLIIPLIVKWQIDKSDYGESLIYSKNTKEIVVVEEDELFGEEVETTKYEDGFWLGLLPPTDKPSPEMLLGVAPMGGILSAIGIFCLYMGYRAKKKKK